MSGGAALFLIALASLVAAGEPALAAVPKLSCRHFLATVGNAGDMPHSVVQSLKPWMALHDEDWNRTDVRAPAQRIASFSWGAQWSGNWIVAYRVGPEDGGHSRFALFVPAGDVRNGNYRRVTPGRSRSDPFDHADCAGIDAALDHYARPL